MMLLPVLTPHGLLTLRESSGADSGLVELDDVRGHRLETAFVRGCGHGLLSLGADEVGTKLPATLSYWRNFGASYVTGLCALPQINRHSKPLVPVPAHIELERIAAVVPPMMGAEYMTSEVLDRLWRLIDSAFDLELAEAGLTVQQFLKSRHPAWNLVGRVHFNLAENPRDAQEPFAFLATYTAQLSAEAKPQHLPLSKALQEYAGTGNREGLLSLLLPVHRASENCAWLKTMVDAGEIYHPLRWDSRQALQFLNDVPALESAGIVVRMPASWRINRPPRPQLTITLGSNAPSHLGIDALLDFRMAVTLEGENLSSAEVERLLAHSDGLVLIHGRWVEVDHARLKRTLELFGAVDRRAARDGLSFGEAMRMLAGADITGNPPDSAGIVWAKTVAGPWLAKTLARLRRPDGRVCINSARSLHGTLRPYQTTGVEWLRLLTTLRLGACLADDMGLGKTIQILALLLGLKEEAGANHSPCLLVAPASLLSNWVDEIARFAPGLNVSVVHPSARPADAQSDGKHRLDNVDLVITSYGYLTRSSWLQETAWRLAILDEAQAIKNPAAKQTRAVKQLRTGARIALTGTPVENRLADLWSIFDFINPGLLGSAKEFASYVKQLAGRPENPYGPLRDLVRPYILRRLKTDKSIIADLPDKTEVKSFCFLSRKQAALYQRAVDDLAASLENTAGIERRGIVLAFLMRLKQICNHPSQWLGDDAWTESESGKFARLRELAEVIGARQEKMLVFTQFRETCTPLAAFLGSVFGRSGLVLHGATAVSKRKDLVGRFQEDDRVPYFVVSLKAGGVGLNLTAASHVIHFDRWWNPAVENQATDRAFRIGQTKNVLVHKFVCRGTIEEKIDRMIESKVQLASDVLGGGADTRLTEMSDRELLDTVALDLAAAMKES